MFSNAEKLVIYHSACFMYPFSRKSSVEPKDILRYLSIFGNPNAEYIAGTEYANDVIIDAAMAIQVKIQQLGHKYNQIRWGENTVSIVNEVLSKYPNLQQELGHVTQQRDIYLHFKDKISNLRRILSENITALISTEEEAQELRDAVCNKINKLYADIYSSELEEREELFQGLIEIKQEMLNFITKKLHEEPVKLLYYKTGNRVAVKMKWHLSSFQYRVGRGKEFRLNKGKDNIEYPIIVSVSYIHDLLYQNGIRDEDVLVSIESVDAFYSFEDQISVNLTSGFVNAWWNYDCPVLYRHTPNKYRHTNMLGMPIPHFTTSLIESTYREAYVDEDITEEEAHKLIKGRDHTMIGKTVAAQLKARQIREDLEKIELIRYAVESFDEKIQSLITRNAEEIKDSLMKEFPERVSYKIVEGEKRLVLNDDFGLDCGWINIYTTDPSYVNNRTLLRQLDNKVAPWMDLKLPYMSQSVTVQEIQFKKLQEIVQKETGIILLKSIVWD